MGGEDLIRSPLDGEEDARKLVPDVTACCLYVGEVCHRSLVVVPVVKLLIGFEIQIEEKLPEKVAGEKWLRRRSVLTSSDKDPPTPSRGWNPGV
ncbi:unnamed protein product [Microthlaspi erraticum]|uniref:Uncharacterized protein n=1 Tax=Microthlaspi erraticum TaxID=1685480 RepID=A0A6D2HV26_9BRAS|nr:unnamed protein product [Microthlaspi erraticum]